MFTQNQEPCLLSARNSPAAWCLLGGSSGSSWASCVCCSGRCPSLKHRLHPRDTGWQQAWNLCTQFFQCNLNSTICVQHVNCKCAGWVKARWWAMFGEDGGALSLWIEKRSHGPRGRFQRPQPRPGRSAQWCAPPLKSFLGSVTNFCGS